MQYKAFLNNYRMSPRKVRLVADVVRNKSVDEAVLTLTHLHKKSAEPIRKLIQSAAANAKNLDSIPTSRLVVESIYVNEGPTMRRFRPRAFGRAFMIRKRTSKVTVILQSQEVQQKKTPSKKSQKSVEGSTDSAKKPVDSDKKAVSAMKKSTKTSK
jgi:large subunit ribosomal protein L22